MKFLIIGGSNFIGWQLVELLGKTNHLVTVVNRGDHPRAYPDNITHHIADRKDYDKMAAAIGDTNFDAVFDMCGYVESDMTHTVQLFGERTKKYIFVSTAATYLAPLVLPITENSPQGSHSIWGKYGSGKLACERVMLSAYKKSNFPAVIVRPSYVYGVGNMIDRETFLFDRISKGRLSLSLVMARQLSSCEVSDLCKALVGIAETPKGFGECYNISGKELVTLKSLVELVQELWARGTRP